ncbi:MAG TPA: cytochrome c3 family protein [Roseiflexaceae bacterium]|nr:cytochrome c3 family protein [Roseiflexaceae bacterium]
MSQLFPRRANLLARLSVYGIFAVAALGVIGLLIYSRSPYPAFAQNHPDQPVPYSHALHISLGLNCQYCHTSVTTSASASLPTTQTCMTCHSQIRTDSEALKPVRDSYANGTPIEWNRVHDLGDFAYFNHSIHVSKGVGCSTCHGQVSQMGTAQQVAPLTMGWCLDCHRAPEQYLRPQDQIFNTDWVPPADQLAQGRQLVQANNIQVSKLQNCTICHR